MIKNDFINIMNENGEVVFKSNADGLNFCLSRSSDSSPPASPIREELVRFHSNNPVLKSLNDYYAFDPLSPGKDDPEEEFLQSSTGFVSCFKIIVFF